MSYSDAGLDRMADGPGYANETLYISAHTADPGSTGANEVVGGTYARGTALFDAVEAKGGGGRQVPITATVQVPVGTGNTVTHIGLWTLASGGVFLDGRDTTDVTFSTDGNLNVTAYTLTFENTA